MGFPVTGVSGEDDDPAILCPEDDLRLDLGFDMYFAEHVIREMLVHGVSKEANDLCCALGRLGCFHGAVSAPLVIICRSRLTEAGEKSAMRLRASSFLMRMRSQRSVQSRAISLKTGPRE